jgi:hypothetical protein
VTAAIDGKKAGQGGRSITAAFADSTAMFSFGG